MKHNHTTLHAFMLKCIWKYDKTLFFQTMLRIPLNVINSLLNIYITSIIVGIVVSNQSYMLLITLLFFSAWKLFISIVMHWSEKQLSNKNYDLKMKFVSDYAEKYMKIDYAYIESAEGKDLAQRAKSTMFHFDYRAKPMVEAYLSNISVLLAQAFGLLSYGGIIAILNPAIIIVLLITASITYVFQKYMVAYDRKDRLQYVPIERKIHYLMREAQNFKAAKDIKIYGMKHWFTKMFDEQISKRVKFYKKRGKISMFFNVVIAVVNLLFNGFIYVYLIYQYRNAGLDIQSFILYFGLITGFNSWLLCFISGVEDLQRVSFQIEDLKEFLFCGEGAELSKTKTELMSSESSIEFDNVSYRYGKKEKMVLKNISFRVAEGDKIAIVGINGAGKTTLIKLLCGLYKPTSGVIRIGGTDIAKVNPGSLFQKFSVVFQEIYLLPTSIERNIAQQKDVDKNKMQRVLFLSGMSSKVEKLPQKQETVLLKSVQDEAIELSGGEIQKLALARALYKNGDIMVLDEPTAALDPIAENEMYQQYNQLTKGKTSIFISHRLSSTRFCDRILFLENGVIAECGTHEELMKMNGRYAKMYEIQSQYYQERKREG